MLAIMASGSGIIGGGVTGGVGWAGDTGGVGWAGGVSALIGGLSFWNSARLDLVLELGVPRSIALGLLVSRCGAPNCRLGVAGGDSMVMIVAGWDTVSVSLSFGRVGVGVGAGWARRLVRAGARVCSGSVGADPCPVAVWWDFISLMVSSWVPHSHSKASTCWCCALRCFDRIACVVKVRGSGVQRLHTTYSPKG